MPVKQITPTRSSQHDALVHELLGEWRQPNAQASEPVILEEAGPNRRVAHLYVIWGKWAHLDRVERSEIIMDAAEKKLSQPDLLEITIAMGLTPDEADRLGIQWR